MIQITPQTRILLQIQAVDFRRGIDGLVALSREVLRQDPFSGTLFVFRNRLGTAIKALIYDGQGFWLMQKRFSEGKLRHWPCSSGTEDSGVLTLAAQELQVLLWNGNPRTASFAPEWRKLPEPS
jgi:transposase